MEIQKDYCKIFLKVSMKLSNTEPKSHILVDNIFAKEVSSILGRAKLRYPCKTVSPDDVIPVC